MTFLTPFRALIRGPTAAARAAHLPLTTSTIRPISATTSPRLPYKDDQDRESLKPHTEEYSKSGGDGETAANEDAAFNPDKTSPEEEKKTAGQGGGSDGNPLDISPANKELAEGGRGKGQDKPHGGQQKPSGGSSGPKGGR